GNGARELMILLADSDPAKAWQGPTATTREEPFRLAADIFLYSVDKQNLRRRGESYLVTPDAKIATTRPIKLARIQYNGNYDPEPGGWRRLAAMLHNTDKVDLQLESATPDKLSSFKLARLTGTGKVVFAQEQRDAIRKFLDAGGTLLIDAAGGSTDFATSIES